MREGLAASNPVLFSNKATDERSRDRVLTDAELVAIWRACRADQYGTILKLLILTAARHEEVGGMRKDELDLERRLWVIPRERAKNDRAHILPLSPSAVALLTDAAQRSGRDLVFGEGEGSFSGWSKCKARLDERIAKAGLELVGWRLHDIRRTAASGMAQLGAQPHIIERVLNHAGGQISGIAAVYNRHTYESEMRRALELWAEHVMAVVSGDPQKGANRSVRATVVSAAAPVSAPECLTLPAI